jgi:hypothetical protein
VSGPVVGAASVVGGGGLGAWLLNHFEVIHLFHVIDAGALTRLIT